LSKIKESLKQGPEKWSRSWAGFLLTLVLAAYFPVMIGGGWIWDDNDYVTENPLLENSAGLYRIWTDPTATPQYYPVVHTSFWIEHQLWGENPVGYHTVNVLLMALIGVLFWKFLLRLGIPGAWFIAALFALHPIHVESVAWVTERKNMLSMAFLLAAALSYWRYVESAKVSFLLWCVVSFGLGMLSKTVIAFFPAAMFLLLWWRKPNQCRRHVLPLGVLLSIGAWAGWRTAMLEVSQVGAEGAAWAWTVTERFLLAGKILWSYALHVLAPNPQFLYPKWIPNSADFFQWCLLATAVALPIVLWWKSKSWGRGPLVAILIFGGAIFPALGFLDVYPMKFSFLADHFQFHANLALVGLFGFFLTHIPLSASAKRLGAAALLLGCIGMVWAQAPKYENEQALWEHTIAENPAAWMAWHNLGSIHVEAGNKDQALACYQTALKLERDPKLLNSMSSWWLHRAAENRWDQEMLQQAATYAKESETQWPNYYWTHITLGHIYANGLAPGLPSAVKHYQAAIRIVREKDWTDAQKRAAFGHPGFQTAIKNLQRAEKSLQSSQPKR
jgi:tetratricopeptide (TPR) repeat protein